MLNKNNFLIEMNLLLKKLKIKKDDNLLLHSNSAGINQIQKFKKNKNQLYNLFINTLLKKIGRKGTLVMPTYNYDFTKGKAFNYKKTLGQVGELNNFFLKKKVLNVLLNPYLAMPLKVRF